MSQILSSYSYHTIDSNTWYLYKPYHYINWGKRLLNHFTENYHNFILEKAFLLNYHKHIIINFIIIVNIDHKCKIEYIIYKSSGIHPDTISGPLFPINVTYNNGNWIVNSIISDDI